MTSHDEYTADMKMLLAEMNASIAELKVLTRKRGIVTQPTSGGAGLSTHSDVVKAIFRRYWYYFKTHI